MKLLTLISLFVLVLAFACKKKKEAEPATPEQPASVAAPAVINNEPSKPRTYDTIFPGTYFPVYPGSTWKYLDQNNNVVELKTESQYILDVHHSHSKSDTFYVPVYEKQKVWEYKFHDCGTDHRNEIVPFIGILSETLTVGHSWVIQPLSIGNEASRKVIARDTSITIAGVTYSPIIVTEDYKSKGGPSFYLWFTRRYYAKGIGLVKETTNNYFDKTITTTKAIVSYTINK